MSVEPDADAIIVHMNSLHLTLRVLICLLFVVPIADVDAAHVADLYAAEVSTESGATRSLPASFDVALRAVLVKVTGRRDVTSDPLVMKQFSTAETYVQQYRTLPDGTVWVLFDRVALRRALDGIGQPIWGEERPATLVWLVMDYGRGTRDILAAEAGVERAAGSFSAAPPQTDLERQAAVREILQSTAIERGLPLILPLVDSEELGIVSISDVWGGFTESLDIASQRYGADAILIGRARVRSVEIADVRWTLLLGDEQFDWDGDISSGPDRIADLFAARLATSSNASGQMQLRVDGVESLDDYGRLSQYLSSLDVIEEYSVDQVADQTVIFSLLVRGDADRLMRGIALRRVLQPIDDSSDMTIAPASSLHYALIAGP